MTTAIEGRTTEVAPGIFQITTWIADIDFSFNQYLITGDEPMLFHTGPRAMFPLVSKSVSSVIPVDTVRWIGFGHYEADECGSMNEWLEVAPNAQVGASATACMVSVGDQSVRPPVAFTDAGTYDLGGHVMRWIDTPHVPHAWEAGVLYDETTKTLLCGDLFTQLGANDASSDDDPMEKTIMTEDVFHYSCLAPHSGATVRKLAELDVDTLAVMHGPAYTGDCKAALLALADDFDRRIAAVS
jgi:flavorubredoxin